MALLQKSDSVALLQFVERIEEIFLLSYVLPVQ